MADAGADADALVAQAEAAPLDGWDFSYLAGRMVWSHYPWVYEAQLAERAAPASAMLDIDTGGGEVVAGLPARPPLTVATEPWTPNLRTARDALGAVGGWVVQVERAPDNTAQAPGDPRGSLPFRTGSFDLVACRHGSYVPAEVARVLAPGGVFLTQQWGGPASDELRHVLGLASVPAEGPAWTVDYAVEQLGAARFDVVEAAECVLTCTVHDVGALAWWLRRVPWELPEVTLDELRPSLRLLHDRIGRDGPVEIHAVPFWFEAVRLSP